MKLIAKVLLSIPLVGLLVALWLIGVSSISEDIHNGHVPMYKMGIAFGIPEWLPLVCATIIILIFSYAFLRATIIDAILANQSKN